MRPLFILLLALVPAFAQLPVARLTTIFPPGAQIGGSIEVRIDGSDLDDAKELRFSHPGITSALKPDGRFVVTVASIVPASIYDVRAIGRFGASNPRGFVVGHHPHLSGDPGNAIAAPATIHGKTAASTVNSIKFQARQGQRLFLECLTRRIDSKLDPVLIIVDSQNKELARARTGGFVDFTAPAAADFTLKLHDVQYRGGDEFFFCLNVNNGPWLDFALPTAVERGVKSKITVYGRNLPNGKPSEFKSLEQVQIEVEAPFESQSSYINRRPADAAVEGFEFRLDSSNPILLTLLPQSPAIAEIFGQFYPANETDTHHFDAAEGDILAVEIFSHRLGLNTDPFAVIQRVTKNDNSEDQVSDVQEMYDNDQNAGGQEFNTTTRDPSWRFEVKDTGTYRIKVRDLFNKNAEPRKAYRLSIRKESPNFSLIAYAPAPPPQNKDSKEIAGAGLFLRRGDAIPIRVLALRRDNYTGPIDIAPENLPTGVTTAPSKIPAGANNGWMILSASEDAPAWIGALQIVGKAKINDREISRRARAGSIAWNVADYSNEAVASQLNHELVLAVSGAELAPLAIAAPSGKLEAVADSKINIPISINRRGDFNNPIKFRAYLDPLKEFEADGKATNATFEIDLKQSKLGPGSYTFPIYASSPGKYRRITPTEAKAMEAEIKTLKENLAAIAEAAKKEATNSQIKSLEAKLQIKDATAAVWTSIALTVLPPPAQKTP